VPCFIAGIILQFPFFKHNAFGILLLLFWLCGLAMAALSYTLSNLVRKTQSAVYLGFGMFIVGWMFQAAILVMGDSDNPYAPNSYYSKTSRWGRVLFWVFNLTPWNPLTKGIRDLNAATLTAADPGLHWSQLNSYCRWEVTQQSTTHVCG
jgi:ABC-type transport system involved in multi-copper enzyme maturation permease subunit